jgi:hypothetical protein
MKTPQEETAKRTRKLKNIFAALPPAVLNFLLDEAGINHERLKHENKVRQAVINWTHGNVPNIDELMK